MDITLKNLIGRLNPVCHAAFEAAAGACIGRGGDEVTIEDVLLQLLEGVETDLALLLRQERIAPEDLRSALQRELDRLPASGERRPVFAQSLIHWLEQAWLYTSVELGGAQVRSAALCMALRADSRLLGTTAYAELIRSLPASVAQEPERSLLMQSAEAEATGTGQPVTGGGSAAGAIEAFTNDFTARAQDAALDPVLGRDDEIRQVLDVLGRRRKNNPILVGEAGVGKTAVVEGLAQIVAAGDAPPTLTGGRVLELDLAALQAGAGVRGEFEKRLRGLLEELLQQPEPVVLFIDEAHTLIGAGGEAGSGDAANLLKPVLARGDLKVIAATTWPEYRRYFERDAALARRFQPIRVDEPTPDAAATILRGLRSTYESAHDVYIRDDALVAAAELSARYISGRQLPDKAVDLLDTACARVAMALHATPADLDRTQRRIQQLERERANLERDLEQAAIDDRSRLALLDDELETLRARAAQSEQAWRSERALVEQLVSLRQGSAETADRDSASDGSREEFVRMRAQLAEATSAGALIPYEVSPDVVSRVVSDWTGIPLGRLVQDESEVLLGLQDRLAAQVRGQDDALATIGERIRIAKAGLTAGDAPLGVFLLVGPSGVGKTETAHAVAQEVFGGGHALVTVNMSEFQERHTVSRLIGSPPGYVGYGEGGVLTEAVRQRPYSAVLFDEVEKAHPDVMSLFYQLLDKGTLADGEGRVIDFRNTVVFLTSNIGSDTLAELCDQRPDCAADELVDSIRGELNAHFRPALLARMQVVPYRALPRDVLTEIVSLKLDKTVSRLREQQGVDLEFGPAVAEYVLERCTVGDAGARNVEAVINRQILPEMARDLLGQLGSANQPSRCRVDVAAGQVSTVLED